MRRFKEVAEQFSESLSTLKCCSQSVIKTLTKIAEEEMQNAEAVTFVIEDRLKNVKPDVMLALMFLIDSICKEVRQPYNELFEKELVSNFCHVFRACDKKSRSRLHELRKAWGPRYHVFTEQKLRQLDLAIRKIDPAWPLASKQTKIDDNQDRREAQKKQHKEEQNLIEKEENCGEKKEGIKRPQLSQGLKVSPEKKIRLNQDNREAQKNQQKEEQNLIEIEQNCREKEKGIKRPELSPDSGIELEDSPRLACTEKNTQALKENFPRPVWTERNKQALKKSLLQVAGIKNSFPLNFDRLKYFPDLDREGQWCRDDPLNSPFPGEYSPAVSVSGHPVLEASEELEVAEVSGGQEERSAIRQKPQEANTEFNTDKPEPLRSPASPRPSLSEISSYYHLPPLLSPITDPLPPESQHQENRDTGYHRERPSLLV